MDVHVKEMNHCGLSEVNVMAQGTSSKSPESDRPELIPLACCE